MKRVRFRLSPITEETSFRELQQRHGHLVNQGKLVPIISDEMFFKKRDLRTKPKFVGFLPSIEKRTEVFKNKISGSRANVLVHPDKKIHDDEDDVPEFIYTKPKRHREYDTVSKIIKNVCRNKTFATKEQEQRQAERTMVDTLVADYLCNNNFGHVIPVYEGTGLKTCPCCTDRNRETVRNVLGLPTDPDNTVKAGQTNKWISTEMNQDKNIYHLGSLSKQKVPSLRMDPAAFRLSDAATRANWASSATFEIPDFYRNAISQNYTENTRRDASSFYDFPKLDQSYAIGVEQYNSNTSLYNNNYESDMPIDAEPEINTALVSDRITSATKKYDSAMANLRRFKSK